MNHVSRAIVVTALLALAAGAASCAPQSRFPEITAEEAKAEAEKQRELAVEQMVAFKERLRRVRHPVLKAAAELGRCSDKVQRQVGANLDRLIAASSLAIKATEARGLGEAMRRGAGQASPDWPERSWS
jgi:hypothetical protein